MNSKDLDFRDDSSTNNIRSETNRIWIIGILITIAVVGAVFSYTLLSQVSQSNFIGVYNCRYLNNYGANLLTSFGIKYLNRNLPAWLS